MMISCFEDVSTIECGICGVGAEERWDNYFIIFLIYNCFNFFFWVGKDIFDISWILTPLVDTLAWGV